MPGMSQLLNGHNRLMKEGDSVARGRPSTELGRNVRGMGSIRNIAVIVGLALMHACSSSPSPPSSGAEVATTLPQLDLAKHDAANGWVAFTAGLYDGDHDLYLVREGQDARRIVGSDTDKRHQRCPAFSPDGGRLAYGEAERLDDESGFSGAVLVIAALDPEGNLSGSREIPLEVPLGGIDGPPCPLWSPDGVRIALGVSDAIGRPLLDGDVWIVDSESGQQELFPGLWVAGDGSYSDMEWSPDGAELAIAGKQISLYEPFTRQMRVLSGDYETMASASDRWMSWSPNGETIAYQYGGEIRLIDVEDVSERVLATDPDPSHGIGPVWSPDGKLIVYQRTCCGNGEDVIIKSPAGEEVVLPHRLFPGLSANEWFPFRVTWSPDGRQLLYLGWSGRGFMTALIAVPIASNSQPVLLHAHRQIAVYESGYQLGFQTWGRETSPP